jgi:hypothetical protein
MNLRKRAALLVVAWLRAFLECAGAGRACPKALPPPAHRDRQPGRARPEIQRQCRGGRPHQCRPPLRRRRAAVIGLHFAVRHRLRPGPGCHQRHGQRAGHHRRRRYPRRRLHHRSPIAGVGQKVGSSSTRVVGTAQADLTAPATASPSAPSTTVRARRPKSPSAKSRSSSPSPATPPPTASSPTSSPTGFKTSPIPWPAKPFRRSASLWPASFCWSRSLALPFCSTRPSATASSPSAATPYPAVGSKGMLQVVAISGGISGVTAGSNVFGVIEVNMEINYSFWSVG